MTWTNRVVWQEGMFLRAQHFQQQDRWQEAQLRSRTAALRPYPWGITEMLIDRDLLGTGRFALASAAGVFEDGTPFSIPGEADHPAPLDLPDSARNTLVYLAAPIRQAGAAEVVTGADTEGRYGLREFEAYDTHSDSPTPAGLQVGRLRLRYMLESDDRAGYLCLGVARVTEVAADKRVTLDERWVPPSLVCSAAPPLAGLITELSGMLNQRGEALAARLTAPGARGVAEVADFLLLQSVNRWQKLLSHWADSGNVHPEDLYSTLVQMAGEFATFTETTRRPNTYPAYRHDDLQRSYAPVVADLRRSLSAVIEQTAIAVPLQERQYGVRVGPITDRGILRGSNFVLSVRADMPTENLRRLFPSQVKIGAVEQIRELVNVALPGIAVRPLPVAPRQIPFYAGASYFELDRNSPHWQQMQSSGGFAIHVSGEFPNLQMELWAIRG
ncbi:type VI secretion system baseplate subunit TssK [Limobrevibacterium gyesilva]|uniref:Type VI secretion system baseplate subunit TssK n=1 Tax=Limobrevibacterium gyesilva TaxID=2991712 RepID=A0AA41YL47_9PROT|nr:type VI secretion system baseplate subunit TssK [Limobrevibacterium gyesilva]MCW3473908.1 type VI secretion system baseplate subunit TssK [Limobrevibacterium gyesilva]